MFCSASVWKRYSLPIRRGVARARLARSADGEVEAGAAQKARRGDDAVPRTLVERARAPDPVEEVGRTTPGLQDAEVQPFGPGGPLGLRLAPGVGRAFDVTEHRLGLAREP